MKRFPFFALYFLFLLFLVVPAGAQEPVGTPILIEPPIWNFDGLRIEYQRVTVTIDEQIATTHIDQLFVNDNDWLLEGTYLFPLPAGATVSQLTMWVNGQAIEARLLPAGEARDIYDEIVRQLRDPALLEYIGRDAIQANVFPIPPHDERRIEIKYSQVLTADNGLFHYFYPQSTNLYTNTALDNQNIRVEVASDEAIRAIYSPTHPVAISRTGDFAAVVGYEAEQVMADQDFELYYSVSAEEISLNLLSYKESGEDGFFLLLVAPTVTVDQNQVVARDIILVLDTSGSMEGDKLAQAKEAAIYVIDHLNPQDRFNIVTFSTGVRNYAPTLQRADDSGDYVTFINGLEALGGTNISGALLEAAAIADPQRPPTILFLTDGLATEGVVETALLLSNVGQAVPAGTRLFAFGVGDDVDTFLLDSLAESYRGTTTYVRPGQAIDEAVSSFYAKVSTPVLTNISLDFGDITVEQLYPDTLPDLFAGSQLVLTGRYRTGGPATITLRGTVNDQEQIFTYADNLFHDGGGGDDFIPRLWATRAIGHLLNEIRLNGENPELVQSIVNLSIRYGIITPYTSYLIQEEDIFSDSGRDNLIEEAVNEMEAPMAESSGSAAVDVAVTAGGLADADAPAPLPTITVADGSGNAAPLTQIVQFVGNKAFVYRDGLWIDTTYQADHQTPQQVGFASDGYFSLLDSAPEIGQYLALGSRVLFVYNGAAYEIVEGEGASVITLPPTANPGQPSGPATPCTAALLLPMVLGVILFKGRKAKTRPSLD